MSTVRVEFAPQAQRAAAKPETTVSTVKHRLPLKAPLRTMREIRVEQGMSLGQLSRLSGVAKGNLSSIETGRRVPTDLETTAISSALGVSLQLRVQLVHEDHR